MIDRRQLMLGTVAAGVAGSAAGQTAPPALQPAGTPNAALPDPKETIDLWPMGSPGPPAVLPVETVVERSKDPHLQDRAVRGISRPRLVVFRPPVPNGSAVLVIPGGAYRRIVIERIGRALRVPTTRQSADCGQQDCRRNYGVLFNWARINRARARILESCLSIDHVPRMTAFRALAARSSAASRAKV